MFPFRLHTRLLSSLLVLCICSFHGRAVGKAWTRVLDPGVEASFSPAADFFDLGGHSLLLAKLTSALAEEAGVTLTIQQIIEQPTMDGMARLVEEAAGPLPIQPSITPGLSLGTAEGSSSESGPVVLHDTSLGVVQRAAGTAPMQGGGVAGVAAAVSRVVHVDLEAEARRLDASIYPAGTRKTGCVAMRCDAMRCDAMRCDAMRCDAMLCYAMHCDAMRFAFMSIVIVDIMHRVVSVS